jgi:hypothetical protein
MTGGGGMSREGETLTNCFVRRWLCAVHGPKPPLHRHNWLSFGKFQDTERFLIPCPRHVSSRLPSSGETCKYATAPITQKNLGEIFYLLMCSFLLSLSWLLRYRIRKFRRDLWITLHIISNYLCSSLNMISIAKRLFNSSGYYSMCGV